MKKKKFLHQSKQQRKENVHRATQPNQYAGRIIRSETFSSSQTNVELQVNCNSNIKSTYWIIQPAVKFDMLESLKHHSTHDKMTTEKVQKILMPFIEAGKHFNTEKR